MLSDPRRRKQNPSRIRACEEVDDRRAPGVWPGAYGLRRSGRAFRRRERCRDDLPLGNPPGNGHAAPPDRDACSADCHRRPNGDRNSIAHATPDRDARPANADA